MFELMGLAEDFLRAGHRITGVSLYGESERIAHAGFGMLETRYPFVLGLPQDETERILEERVTRRGVQVERNKELIGVRQLDSGVSARLRALPAGRSRISTSSGSSAVTGRTARFATSWRSSSPGTPIRSSLLWPM
jgi:hypothetical protein